MAVNEISEFIQHLRNAVHPHGGADLTDGQLLHGYVSNREQSALATLVRRHGPMVWSVCRRILGNWHDAEDAFQATFLVLVRKAPSIASRDLLADWLYGVAQQTALKARATGAKRRSREVHVTEIPEPTSDDSAWNDLRPVLDQELSALPSKYRAVIVLCDLEGKTRKEVAIQLGVPEGTVASRMATARTMLARRLIRLGLPVSGGVLANVLSHNASASAVPASVIFATIKAANLYSAVQAVAGGAISIAAAALAEGILKAMLFNKIKLVVVVVATAGLLAGAGIMISSKVDFAIALGSVKSETSNPHLIRAKDPKLIKEFEYLVYDLGKGVELRLVKIAARGKSFMIGSSAEEQAAVVNKYFEGKRPDWMDDENERQIRLTNDYFIGQFEITRGQFRRFVEDTGFKTEAEEYGGGYGWNGEKNEVEGRDKKYSWQNNGFSQTDDDPVVNVTWNDAKKFCEWLAKKSDGKVRLPGEAEWEYACRAGSTSRFCFGDDEEDLTEYGNVADAVFRAVTKKGWGIKTSDGIAFTAPVGMFKPNGFGLYDMHGNAFEWCEDWFGKYSDLPKANNQLQTVKQSDTRRVLRGGSWADFPGGGCRSAFRAFNAPDCRNCYYGFRVVVLP